MLLNGNIRKDRIHMRLSLKIHSESERIILLKIPKGLINKNKYTCYINTQYSAKENSYSPLTNFKKIVSK